MALPATLRVEELSSGTTYGYVLPNVQRMLLSGFFPQPIVPLVRRFVNAKLDADSEMTDEQLGEWEQFRAVLVAWMVRETDGQAAKFTADELQDPDLFPQDDLADLFSRGIRLVAAPKAARSETA